MTERVLADIGIGIEADPLARRRQFGQCPVSNRHQVAHAVDIDDHGVRTSLGQDALEGRDQVRRPVGARLITDRSRPLW